MVAVISVYRQHAPKSPHSKDLIWSVDYFTTGYLSLRTVKGQAKILVVVTFERHFLISEK